MTAAGQPKLANLSALGVSVFAWRPRCDPALTLTVFWAAGMDGPMATLARDGRPGETTLPIEAPERYGWQDPTAKTGKAQFQAVRKLAEAFAADFERAA